MTASPNTRTPGATDDDMERIGRITAVRDRVGERPDDVQHLDDRARPAVRDEQRQCPLVR